MSDCESGTMKDDEERGGKEAVADTGASDQQASTSSSVGAVGSNVAPQSLESNSSKYNTEDLKKLQIHIEIKKPKTDKPVSDASFDPNLIAPVRRPGEGKVPIFSRIPLHKETNEKNSKGESFGKKSSSDKKKLKSDRDKKRLLRSYWKQKKMLLERLDSVERMRRDLDRQQNRLRSQSPSSSSSSSSDSSRRGRSHSGSSRSRSASRSSKGSNDKRARSGSGERRRRRRSQSGSHSRSRSRDRRRQLSQERTVRNDHRRRDQGSDDSMDMVPYLPNPGVPWAARPPFMRPFMPGPGMPMYPPMMYAPPNFRPFPPMFRGAPRHMNKRP